MGQMNPWGSVNRHNCIHLSLTFAPVLSPHGGLWLPWKPMLPLTRPSSLGIQADPSSLGAQLSGKFTGDHQAPLFETEIA